MPYPVDSALFQWEEGDRRLRELAADPMLSGRVRRAVDAVRDELRRRIGPTYSTAELAELYGRGTDWCLEAASRAAFEREESSTDLDPEAIVDGAFYLHLRGATDYSGGRLLPQD